MLVVTIAIGVGLATFAPAARIASARPLFIAVTPPEYDNMSYVLDHFGYPYTNITVESLWDVTYLEQFNTVFINCAAPPGGGDNLTDPPADQLRMYVEEGGAIYASDWAYEYLNASWPGMAEYAGKIAPQQDTVGEIVDPGLRDYLGQDTVNLTYDLGSWNPIVSVGPDVDVYVTNTVHYGDEYGYNDTEHEDVPTVIGFEYGTGYVLYTSFHEAAQSNLTLRLMEYLVLIPLTQTNWRTLESEIGAAGYTTLKVNRGTISRDGSLDFPLDAAVVPYGSAGRDLLFGLRWDKGELTLRVLRPDGTLYREVSSTYPSILIDVQDAEAGTWTYEVAGHFIPYANYPFVAAVGYRASGDSSGGTPAVAPPPAATAVAGAIAIAGLAGAGWAWWRRVRPAGRA